MGWHAVHPGKLEPDSGFVVLVERRLQRQQRLDALDLHLLDEPRLLLEFAATPGKRVDPALAATEPTMKEGSALSIASRAKVRR